MIKFMNVKEGDRYPEDHLIVMGKNIVGNRTWGYYILFNSPIKKTTEYIDPFTFEPKIGPVRNKYIVRWASDQKKVFFKKARSPAS